MRKKNFSSVLFKQIERLSKQQVRGAAKQVASQMAKAEERVDSAWAAYEAAEKDMAKRRKALKKFKKSGSLNDLEIFGVGNSPCHDDIPF